MIKTLYSLGLAIRDAEPDYFFPWERPFTPKQTEKAKVVVFDVLDNQLQPEPELEDYRPEYADKYLYRALKGPNGTNLVPTFRFYAEANSDKHHENTRKLMVRIQASVKNQKFPFLASKEEISKLESALVAFGQRANPEYQYLLTFKIEGKWFGEHERFRRLFEEEAYTKYYEKSLGKDQVCAITYQRVPEVWGRVDTLGFTVNDATFSRGGFDPKQSFKMFPVSPEAVAVLEGSRRYVLEQLTLNFFGLRYFVIPHFIQGSEEAIRYGVREFIKAASKKSLEGQTKAIFNNESILSEIVGAEGLSDANVYYDLFFFQQNQAQFLIKLQLSDVLPSQIGKIFQVKNQIEGRYQRILAYHDKKNQEHLFYVTFARIKDYFSKKTKTDTVFHPFFFKVVEAVFYGSSLQEQAVLDAWIQRIRADFKQRNENPYDYLNHIKETWAFHHFFQALGLFGNNPFNINNMNNDFVQLDAESFVAQHSTFFNHPAKVGAFYLGCLTEILLNKQRKKLESEPFLKNLNGLNLDLDLMRSIFPRLLDKIKQYENAFNYKLELNLVTPYSQKIAHGLMASGTGASRSELSYAFSCGLVMQKEFAKNLGKNNEGATLDDEINSTLD